MFLFDTDIFTLFVHGHTKVNARADREPAFAVSIVTRIEILRGRIDFVLKASSRAELLKAQSLLDEWENRLAGVRIVAISEPVAIEFERLRAIKSLKKIGRGDLLIASVTLAHQATLITRNVKDFKLVPGLRYENWAD
jgi:tRNA(fMet)-specific endonuclease VapC